MAERNQGNSSQTDVRRVPVVKGAGNVMRRGRRSKYGSGWCYTPRSTEPARAPT